MISFKENRVNKQDRSFPYCCPDSNKLQSRSYNVVVYLQMHGKRYYVLAIMLNIVAVAPFVCGVAHKNVKSLNKIFKTKLQSTWGGLTDVEYSWVLNFLLTDIFFSSHRGVWPLFVQIMESTLKGVPCQKAATISRFENKWIPTHRQLFIFKLSEAGPLVINRRCRCR